MRKRSLAYLALLLVAVLLLSGCDKSNGANSDPPEKTAIPTLPPNDYVETALDDAVDEGEPSADDAQDSSAETETDIFGTQDDTADLSAANDTSENAGAAKGPGLPETAQPTLTPSPLARLTPDPSETPIGPIDPIDKPTEVPLNIAFVAYSNDGMGVTFERPAGWKDEAPADSNVQFTEPKAAARDGYCTMLTVRVLHKSSKQVKEDAEAQLAELMDELSQNTLWVDFKAQGVSSASMDGANGYYAYYTAVFQGINVRGRMMVVAHGNALYMVRLTAPTSAFTLYEEVYRKVRSTWNFY